MTGTVDTGKVHGWAQRLYGDAPGWVAVCSFPNRHHRHIPADDADAIAQAVAELGDGDGDQDVYLSALTVTKPAKGRGTEDHARALVSVWADLDIAGPTHKDNAGLPTDVEGAHRILEEIPIPPTVVLHSGGGLQPRWVLDTPWVLDTDADRGQAKNFIIDWGRVVEAAAERAGYETDDGVWDLARLLRAPGTWNRKTVWLETGDQVLPIDYHDRGCGQRYTRAQVAAHFLPEPADHPEARSLPPRRDDGWSAAKWVNEHVPWDEILHDWHKGATDREGRTYWTRPGKNPRAGHSATTRETPPVLVNWSTDDATEGLPVGGGNRLTKFRVYAHRFHGGDQSAAAIAITERHGPPRGPRKVNLPDHLPPPAEPPDSRTATPEPLPDPFIDWATFWSRDRREAEWTYPDVLARGRGHAIYASHKAGKSLLMLYVAAELVTGPDPQVVVYLDYEMGEDDLYERLDDMGYGPDVDLTRLRYALLPFLPPLDTAAGAHAVTELLDRVQHDWPDHHMVVVIDTMGRAVHGEENSSDTFRAFYTHTGIELKRRGVTWARLDHAGKDPTKGQRGSSGKGDDVDVVWKLTRTQNGATLQRDVARMSWVPEQVSFAISDDPLTFKRIAGDWPDGTSETAAILDELDVELDASTRTATAALKDAGLGRRRQVVVAALKWRRERPRLVDNHVDNRREPPREPPPRRNAGTTPGTTHQKPRNQAPEPPREPPGTTPAGQTGTTGTPLRGTGVPAPTARPPSCICPCHRDGGDHGGRPCPGCDLEATA